MNPRLVEKLIIPGFLLKRIHHRGTEFAEFGELLNQKLFTPRPPRLGGAISEQRFTGKPEDPTNLTNTQPDMENRTWEK